jgi:hypothetical protein
MMMMPVCERGHSPGTGFACLFAHLFRPCTVLQETTQPGFQCSSSVLKKKNRRILYCSSIPKFWKKLLQDRVAQESNPRPPRRGWSTKPLAHFQTTSKGENIFHLLDIKSQKEQNFKNPAAEQRSSPKESLSPVKKQVKEKGKEKWSYVLV